MRFIKVVLALIIIFVLTIVGFVYLAPEKATKLAINMEHERSGLTRKEINLSGDLHYVYLEGGQD